MRWSSRIRDGNVSRLAGGRCGAVVAAEPVAWLADEAAAITRARKQGKLLLVVQLTGDFAKNSAESREAQIYRRVTLADRRVAAALADRFVVTYRHVGEADTLQRQYPPKQKPPLAPAEQAITYVCLPDLRVLHCVPGFVSADELLKELAWVEGAYSKLLQAPEAEQPLALRTAHLAAVAKADAALFAKLFPSRWQDSSLAGGRIDGRSAAGFGGGSRRRSSGRSSSGWGPVGSQPTRRPCWPRSDRTACLAASSATWCWPSFRSSPYPTCSGRRLKPARVGGSGRPRGAARRWRNGGRKHASRNPPPCSSWPTTRSPSARPSESQPLVWPPENVETLTDLPRFSGRGCHPRRTGFARRGRRPGPDPLQIDRACRRDTCCTTPPASGEPGSGNNESTTRLAQALHAVIKSGDVAAAGEKGE